MNQKINALAGITIILVFAVMGVLFVKFGLGNIPFPNFGISSLSKSITAPESSECTMEAKLCPDGSAVGRSGLKCEFEPCPGAENAGVANPASVYCEKNGGTLKIKTAADGGQTGYCTLKSGEECEEWSYMRGTCPGSSNTADWKKYRNEKYDFEFKYPSNWALGDSPNSIIPDVNASEISFDRQKNGSARFHVAVKEKLSNCSDFQSCVLNNRVAYSDDQETSGIESIAFAGKSALKEFISRPNSGGWEYAVFYVYEGGNLYVISQQTNSTDRNQVKKELDGILSTFQFIN